jgi:hypothetical protein
VQSERQKEAGQAAGQVARRARGGALGKLAPEGFLD